MNAFSIVFLIEPFIYYNMQAAETGHALHVLKTLLYSASTVHAISHQTDALYTG